MLSCRQGPGPRGDTPHLGPVLLLRMSKTSPPIASLTGGYTRDCLQGSVCKGFLCEHEDPSSIPKAHIKGMVKNKTKKPDTVAYACTPSTGEVKTGSLLGGSLASQHRLLRRLQASGETVSQKPRWTASQGMTPKVARPPNTPEHTQTHTRTPRL